MVEESIETLPPHKFLYQVERVLMPSLMTARYAGVAPHKRTAAVNALQRAWTRSQKLQCEAENESAPTMATEEPPPTKASSPHPLEPNRSVAVERGMYQKRR